MSGWVWTPKPDTPLQDSFIKRNLYLINYTVWEHSELQKEIETPVLAHAIEDSTDIFGISGGGLNTPNPPRYATDWTHLPQPASMTTGNRKRAKNCIFDKSQLHICHNLYLWQQSNVHLSQTASMTTDNQTALTAVAAVHIGKSIEYISYLWMLSVRPTEENQIQF